MKKSLEIALLIKTETSWHRNIMMGVAQYAEDHHGWNFTVPPVNAAGEIFPPNDWRGDGIICRVTSQRLEKRITELNVPCVNVSWLKYLSSRIPSVYSDERACASLAGRFLLEKQFENFAYIGFPPWQHYPDTIETTLRAGIKQRGYELHSLQLSTEATESFGVDPARLVRWLEELQKPVGIVVWTSAVGQLVTKTCLENDMAVPQSVAVMCIEHDPLWSSLAPIPLSNIDQDPWRVGFTAAKLLHSMIRGDAPPTEPICIEPISIVQRRSTEASAAKDPVLDMAVKFIYQNAKTGLTVNEVVQHVSVSRRGLESRFRNELNCSPAAFIRRIQLQSVARLLRTTKLSISAIADRTGFAYPEVLMRAFKRDFGVTPMQFRGAGSARVVRHHGPADGEVEHEYAPHSRNRSLSPPNNPGAQ